MEEAIKQIGERLKGLRDVLDIPAEEVAETCGITLDKYEKIEKGEVDITISNLMKIAKKYGVSADALMFAEEPHMRNYFVTRKGQGLLGRAHQGLQVPESGQRLCQPQGRGVHCHRGTQTQCA